MRGIRWAKHKEGSGNSLHNEKESMIFLYSFAFELKMWCIDIVWLTTQCFHECKICKVIFIVASIFTCFGMCWQINTISTKTLWILCCILLTQSSNVIGYSPCFCYDVFALLTCGFHLLSYIWCFDSLFTAVCCSALKPPSIRSLHQLLKAARSISDHFINSNNHNFKCTANPKT